MFVFKLKNELNRYKLKNKNTKVQYLPPINNNNPIYNDNYKVFLIHNNIYKIILRFLRYLNFTNNRHVN